LDSFLRATGKKRKPAGQNSNLVTSLAVGRQGPLTTNDATPRRRRHRAAAPTTTTKRVKSTSRRHEQRHRKRDEQRPPTFSNDRHKPQGGQPTTPVSRSSSTRPKSKTKHKILNDETTPERDGTEANDKDEDDEKDAQSVTARTSSGGGSTKRTEAENGAKHPLVLSERKTRRGPPDNGRWRQKKRS